MSKGDAASIRKNAYFGKVHTLIREYKKLFVVSVDNVSSTQFHQIRLSLRGKAVILMGKNTMIRKALREMIPTHPDIEQLISWMHGNVGLVFTNDDLKAVRDIIVSNKVAAPAKVGAISQRDISIPAGNTGISPDKTSFFQALNINTKIDKSAIAIVNDVLLVKKDQKVGASEAELLQMLNIKPFAYGLNVVQVYDEGNMYEPSILDVTDDMLLGRLREGIRNVAAVSLAANFPTAASVPHSFINAYKRLLAVGLATETSFPAAEDFKKALANVSASVAAAPAPAAAPAKAQGSPQKGGKKAAVESSSDSDSDTPMGLFD